MSIERVSSGQPFRKTPFHNARAMNLIIESANAFHEKGVAPSSGQGLRIDSNVVKVRNVTEADRARGELVQLGDPLLDNMDRYSPWFEGNTIAAPAFKLAILLWPTKDEKIGEAQIGGRCIARVDVGDTDHTHAIPVAGEHVLESADFGPFVLLSPPDGTGEQEMWVAFCDVDETRLELTETLTAGGDAAADFMEFTGGNWAVTGRDYDVFDSLGSFEGESGTVVFAQWDPRSMRLEMKQGACEA